MVTVETKHTRPQVITYKVTPDLFYIQDTRFCVGNSASWWCVDGNGYTCDLAKAWKVPGTWTGRPTDVLLPCAEVDALAERHFDVQKLDKLAGAVPA